MVQAPDWATHRVSWNGMEAFYNDVSYIGFKRGRKMWAGKWDDIAHKEAWLKVRVNSNKGRITELFPIQENE